MKNILKIVFILISFTSILNNSAQNNSAATVEQGINKKRGDTIRINRPLSPGNVRIYFSYRSQTGECRFILRPEIEYMTVYLEHTQTHIVYSGEVYADDPVMYQPLDCGVYHITCITDDGSTYAGEVVI